MPRDFTCNIPNWTGKAKLWLGQLSGGSTDRKELARQLHEKVMGLRETVAGVIESENEPIMRKFKPIAIVILLLVVVAVGLIGYGPISFRILFVRLTSSSKWDEYRRLSQLLHIGMDTNKVADILGQPDLPIMGQSNLQCWVYAETGPGASWTFIAQFEKSDPVGHFRLCYCVNINDEAFTTPVWNELGQRQKMAEPVETTVFGLLRKPSQKRTTNE